MEFAIEKKELVRALTRMQAVATKRSALPILSNVLIRAESNLVRISATDLFLSASTTLPAEVARHGAIALPAKELLDCVRALPEGKACVTIKDACSAQIKVAGTKREFRLRGLPVDDFSALLQPDAGAAKRTIASSVLRDLIAKTQFAISTDETRPQLNSALLEWEGDTARMVSTDGHRLSKCEAHALVDAPLRALIPLKGVSELKKFCDDNQDISIVATPSMLFFTCENSMLAIKLTDSEFPPYEQVIPKKFKCEARANCAALIDVVRAISVVASASTGGIRFLFEPNALRIASENASSDSAIDELEIEYDGPKITIGLNAHYVIETLFALKTDDVSIKFSSDLDPVIFEPCSDQKFLGVVMPMRV